LTAIALPDTLAEMPALYDTIGRGYSTTRRADPRIAARIEAALGDARTVLNVGAGAGSYEPADRTVVAVEPSLVMLGQRGNGSAPAVRAVAERLPFADGAFDAAMACLSDHHWADRAGGLNEMRRVARRAVVFQWDPATPWDFWLTRDYLPGFARLGDPRSQGYGQGEALDIAGMAACLRATAVETVPIPWDCVDGFYGAFWRRPLAYLDPAVRAGISVFSRLAPTEVQDGITRLAADLESGAWLERNAALLELPELDLGYRLIIAAGA
jgi:SAM-dependent methyltransferase